MKKLIKIFFLVLFLFYSLHAVAEEKQYLNFTINNSEILYKNIYPFNKNKIIFYSDNVIEFWNPKNLKIYKRIYTDTFTNFSMNKKYMITGNYYSEYRFNENFEKKYINVLDSETGNNIKKINSNEGIYYPFDIKDEKIIAKTYDNVLSIWDTKSYKKINEIQGSAIITKNKNIYTLKDKNTIAIYNSDSGKFIKNFIFKEEVKSITLDKENNIYIALNTGKVNIYNKNYSLVKIINTYSKDIYSLVVNEGKLALISKSEKLAKVFDIKKNNILYKIQIKIFNKCFKNYDIYFPNRIYIESDRLIGFFNSYGIPWIDIWDLNSGTIKKIITPKYRLSDIKVNKDHIIGYGNKFIQIFDVKTGENIKTFEVSKNNIQTLDIDDNKIYSVDIDSIKIFDINTFKLIKNYSTNKEKIVYLKVEDNKLICFLENLTVKILDNKNGKIINKIFTKNFELGNLSFDNDKLIYSEKKEILGLWDIKTSKLEEKFNLNFFHEDKYLGSKNLGLTKENKIVENFLLNDSPGISFTPNISFEYEQKKIEGIWGNNLINIDDLNYLKYPKNEISLIKLVNNTLIIVTKKNKIIKYDISNKKIIYEHQFYEIINDVYFEEKNVFISLNNKIIFIPIQDNKIEIFVENQNVSFLKIKIFENKLLASCYFQEKKDTGFIYFDLNKKFLIKNFSIKSDYHAWYIHSFTNFYDNKIFFSIGGTILSYIDIETFEEKTISFNPHIIDGRNILIDKEKVFFIYNRVTNMGHGEVEFNVLDLNNNKKLVNNLSDFNIGTFFDFDISDNYIYTMNFDNQIIKVWNIDENLNPFLSNSFSIEQTEIKNVLWKAKNKHVFTKGYYQDKEKQWKWISISLWDSITGKLIKTKEFNNEISNVEIENDKLIVFLKDYSINIFNFNDLSLIKKFNNKLYIDKYFINNNNIILILENKFLKIISLKDYKIILDKILEHVTDIDPQDYIFNENDNTIIGERYFCNEKYFYKWDIKNANFLKYYQNEKDYLKENKKLDIIKNHKIIENSNFYKIIDLNNNKSFIFRPKNSNANIVDIYNDLIFTRENNSASSFYIYSLSRNKILARFYNFPDSCFIITPEGYYTGSGNYQNYVHFLKNNEVVEIDELKEEFNKPEIIISILKGNENKILNNKFNFNFD